MAVFLPGGLISNISGNLGGCNFVASGRGNIVRQRIRRPNTSTFSQTNHRTIFSKTARGWASLTDDERAAYNTATATINTHDRFGRYRRLSGYRYYCANSMFFPDVLYHAWPPSGRTTPAFQFTGYSCDLSDSELEITGVSWSSEWTATHWFAARSFSTPSDWSPSNWVQIYSNHISGTDYSLWSPFITHLGYPKLGERIAIGVTLCERGSYPSRRAAITMTVRA